MKTLKFNHASAQAIAKGAKNVTWRVNDDKNLQVNDQIECIDRVQTERPDTWQAIGMATVDAISEKRLGELTNDELHELAAESRAALLDMSRDYYGEGTGEQTPVKIVHFSFVPYEKPQHPQPQTAKITEVQLYADGGSRGNPGPSASGYVLLDMDGNVVKKSGIYLGITTNNQAEYQALKFGLEEAQKLGVHKVHVYMDSMLVVNQMLGIFKVKNRDLWPVHDAVKQLAAQFKSISFTHVPRELNKLADGEVNETLDAELHE